MSGPEHDEPLPPEVPEEFAAAYREAYRRALEEDDVTPAPPPADGPDAASETGPAAALARWRGARWFWPVVAAAVAAVLVLGAYAVGALSSGGDDEGARPARSQPTSSSDASSDGPSSDDPGPGVTEPVQVAAVSADCTAPPGRDSAGRRVTYDPDQAADGDSSTAWRCPGTAVGQRLTLRLPGPAEIASVALIPGYAKTDPSSGVDRYAENNRITRVRWILDDGESVVQRLDPAPSSRDPQRMDVPRTVTDRVVVEILAVKRGPRNTTAISEIELRETR